MQLSPLTHLIGSPNKFARDVLEALFDVLRKWVNQEKAEAIRTLRERWPVTVYILAAGAQLLWTFWSLSHLNQSEAWRLTSWICLTSSLITLLPIASRLLFAGTRLGVGLEVGILSVTLILFARLLLRLPLLHLWSLSTVVLILLLSAGGHSIEMLHDRIRRRLRHQWKEAPGPEGMDEARKTLVQTHLDSIQAYFTGELIIYSALPVGTLLGLAFCWALGVDCRNPMTMVSICLRLVFGLTGSILLWFLGSSFLRMASPVLRLPGLAPSDLSNREQSALDWGSILTDYRKMFFYDAVLNTALVLAFGAFEWFLSTHRGLSLEDPKLVGIVLVGLIVLNEAPYLLGQKQMQEFLTSPYKGWEKNLKDKEVGETIPLVPKFEFFAALVGEASIGGIALEVMKQITELVEKHP